MTMTHPSAAAPRAGLLMHPRLATLRRIARAPKGLIGLLLVGFMMILALFGAWLAPQDPYAQNFMATLQPPSAEHWFGTDQLGRDVFSRILLGARTSIGIGVGGVAVAFVIGVPLGLAAAYLRGTFDSPLMRGVDILLPNRAEAQLLVGDATMADGSTLSPEECAEALLEHAPTVVLTSGVDGVLIARRGHELQRIPVERGDAVDPTGAGDAFSAGLLHGLLAGDDLEAATVTGVRTAREAVALRGGRPPLA